MKFEYRHLRLVSNQDSVPKQVNVYEDGAKLVSFALKDVEPNNWTYEADFAKFLNALGNEGWQIMPGGLNSLFLKREK